MPEPSRRLNLKVTFVILAVITALVIPGYYIAVNRTAAAAMREEQAEWIKAGMPYDFSSPPATPPTPPAGTNLLDSPAFRYWKLDRRISTLGPTEPERKWSNRFGREIQTQPAHFFERWTLALDTPFAPSGTRPALLSDITGVPRAQLILDAMNKDLPHLAGVAADRARFPEVHLGRKISDITALSYGGEIGSDTFDWIYAAGTLRLYASARSALGDTKYLRATVDAGLQHAAGAFDTPGTTACDLGEANLVFFSLPLLHELLERHALNEADLAGIESRLRCIHAAEHRIKALAALAVGNIAMYQKLGYPSINGPSLPDWDELPKLFAVTPSEWTEAIAIIARPKGATMDTFTAYARLVRECYQNSHTTTGLIDIRTINAAQHQMDALRTRPEGEIIHMASGALRRKILFAAATDAAIGLAQDSVALERHRLRHGVYPETLTQLDSDVIPKGGLRQGPLTGLAPTYNRTESGHGYILTLPHENASKTSPGAESTASDVRWEIRKTPPEK